MQQTILAISGKPGLYKLVSRGKNNLIVEALDDTHRRLPTFATDRITSLGDIAMYTEADDVPLTKVLQSMKELEQGKKASVDPKKASGDELRDYFAKVLPDFDRERVHNSDIKKLLQWYNILVDAGINDFEDEEAEEAKEEENVEETKEDDVAEETAEAPKAEEPKKAEEAKGAKEAQKATAEKKKSPAK